ncbi:MAG TPA: glycosyltransferase [Candidatus Acidoferrales bacterium]|jgi:hopene-associated glycosyltransferase HpnB|nr:glycosyltransferase [Candidatus Acidoferrales bacterium]
MWLAAVGGISVAIWLYLLFARGGFWRMREAQPEGTLPNPAPPVVAVIPARNEAAVVAEALASLAAQRYPGAFRIVLADDDSDDGTGAIAQAAAPPERLTVVRTSPLPKGWTGKLWAVSAGIDAALSYPAEYLLLTDADIVHPPDNLSALVARAVSGPYDMVSYMAMLECRTLAEQALIPAFVFFFFMLYPPAWVKLTKPRGGRHGTAGAAGGCILIRRAALERLGGIARISGELIDDCALAAAVQDSGGRVWLGLSTGTRSVRPYAGFGEIGRMISRTAFTQLRHSVWLLIGTVAGLAITYLAPPLLTLLVPRGAAPGLGAIAWLSMSVAYYPALRYYRRPAFWAPLLPLVAGFYLAATVHSALAYWRGAGGLWKGRVQDAS